MAENGRDFLEQSKTSANTPEIDLDKEARLRSLKDRQNEERQKKLEEIKAQALAAQRFKEQKEQERRRRLEELRVKDDVRRQQVEDRKRAISDAERDRLESILRRNQEREQRIEAKKRNEKSNIVFAFGSSTPRMLDPTDMTASFWGHRKATSIQNITCSTSSLTRRQSERDLDVGNKKRATSATGLERSGESSAPITPAGCASGYTGRRRTDLVPTIPTRDSSFASSRKSLNHSPASSRPSSSLSQQSTNSVASSVSVRQRPATTPRRPRPASIAVTGITHDLRNSDKPGENKPPLPKARKPINKTHERPPLKNKAKSPVDSVTKDKMITSVTQNIVNKAANEETQQKPPDTAPVIQQKPALEDHPPEKVDDVQPVHIENPKEDSSKESVPVSVKSDVELVSVIKEVEEKKDVDDTTVMEDKVPEILETKTEETIKEEVAAVPESTVPVEAIAEDDTQLIMISNAENKENNANNEMSSSMTKIRINTEEEAKAALAERRRLIREEAERQAEMERLRLEAEAQAELEKQQREEEQVRQLIELQRQTEQERLKEAIREAQKREEEERLKREEEQRLKLLKEEAEKKAREDAERQKAELQERLKNEEKEREARRKRVEAIMLRTRGKNNANLPSQQSTDDKNENKSEENKVNEENKMNEDNKLHEENKINEESKVNGTKIVEQQENGTTKNGKDVDIVDNIIPGELVKNANTVTIETMNSTDTINSNNSWQDTQQYDSLM